MTPAEYRSIRKQLGLTQAGLANLLGESREIVSMRERHKTPITESASWAILGVLAHFSEKDLRNDNARLRERCLTMNEAAEKLVDAVNSVQSWEETWVGECIQYIDDLIYQPFANARDEGR